MKNDSNLLIYMPLGKAPASQSQLFFRGTCESESAIFPGMWDLRVRVSYFEADLRGRVSYFGPTYESESAILGRPASQSQLFWMSKSHLRVRVSYFSGPPASQSQLFFRAPAWAAMPLEVNPAEACMLGRLWRGEHAPAQVPPCLAQVLPRGRAHHVPASQSQMFSITSYCDSHGHRRHCGATAHRVSTYAGWPS